MANETTLLSNHRAARNAYDASPSIATAGAVLKAASDLCAISDDYTALLDEADDIVAEPA